MLKRTLTCFAAVCFLTAGARALEVQNPRCEYLVNPLGLHEAQPRLSWTLTSRLRADSQTAYQILAASSLDILAKNQGDLWDSKKIDSGDTAQIVYGGKPLQSRQTVFWKVRAWDRTGKESSWSKPARWEMGLLQPSDWSAKWIGTDVTNTKAGGVITIRKARYETVDGSGSLDVTPFLKQLTASNPRRIMIPVKNETFGKDPSYGKVKHLVIDYELDGKPSHAVANENTTLSIPDTTCLRYLRKSFTLDGTIQKATLYATALGLYEARINGTTLGDHFLAPEWTDYRKRVQYQAYDVTSLVVRGPNALGAFLADGWYSGHIGNGGFQFFGKIPLFMAQLEVTYTDGRVQRITTDDSWLTFDSPIRSSDFMLGETYDARLEVPGWDKPQLNENGWLPATIHEQPKIAIEGQNMEPVRKTEILKPKSVKHPKPDSYIYDMGQNMVGIVRLEVQAPADTRIKIRHAEILNPDGSLYTVNLRGAPSIDNYICKGGTTEAWQPQFTFHGFRYVELSGLPTNATVKSLVGIVLGSDTPRGNEFSCSDPRINQLQSNIQWGQRGNYLSVPTDCPQRDERLGWMGDAEVFVRTATYNADVAAFFTKWLVDVDDGQSPEGAFSDVAPNTMNCYSVPAWGDAGVICPWTIYQVYGDTRLLEKHLPAMIRWVEYCRAHSTGLLRDKDRGNDYGDWLSIGADTPKDVIGTAFFAYSTHLVAKACKAAGHNEDAAKYEQLFQDIKAAFNKAYVSADGRIKGNTQCVYAMALKFELLPDNLRPTAAQYLENDIKAKNNHLSTGFVGVSYLLPTLTQAGKLDTAYQLLFQDTFPSWLFSVKHGATTIWERWDGWTPDKGFQDPGMNSFNHYSLGSCGEWLYSTVAGIAIDPGQPGFKHILIQPRPGATLTEARATVHSIRGKISTSWTLKNGKFSLHVNIPANTTATIRIPAKDSKVVTESGKPADKAEGLKFVKMEDGAALYEAGSGDYNFSAPQ
jgi:alpha-L-rhamnosidase